VRTARTLLAAALLLALVIAPACGGGGTTDDTETDATSPAAVSSTATTTFTNDEYGISLTIADRFAAREKQIDGETRTDDDLLYQVDFADEQGAWAGGQMVDWLFVIVWQQKKVITPEALAAKPKLLEEAMVETRKKRPDLTWGEFTAAEVNGVPGWKWDYSQSVGGTTVNGRIYVLYQGDRSYELSIQSAESNWGENEPLLQAAIDSFTVE
jgi:hypothetical protein